mgnify:CR=1 FL=1
MPTTLGLGKNDRSSSVATASQWQLMFWRFKKHRLAHIGAYIVLAFYIIAVLCEFIAPYMPTTYNSSLAFAPPQRIRFIDYEGNLHLRPFVYGWKKEFDLETFETTYVPDTDQRFRLRFLLKGEPYKFMGVFPGSLRLFGVEDGYFHLFGTDNLGRDLFSRIIYGARISMSIGLLGVVVSFILGMLIGGFSGYRGGMFDLITQRVIEFLRSIPTIPLWMSLAAALPKNWSAIQNYFAITVILSLLGWTGLAREVRSKFMALREEDFITAARLSGTSELMIITRHMIPSFMSHIITAMTLAIPAMILGETSLSFLGVGLQPPVVSWGVLLQQAQNLRSVALAPWLMLPGLFVFVVVLAFNFLGDGLRDAADPYS